MKKIENFLTEKGFQEFGLKKNVPTHSGSHLSVQDLIRQFSENLLSDFFNHYSDANKFLEASQQEELENDFKKYVKSL